MNLGISKDDKEISYINLFSRLKDVENVDESLFRQVFDDIEWQEEKEVEYNKLPLAVSYAQIPVVIDGLLLVKLVKLEQGDNLAIILPDGLAQVYKQIQDDINNINIINTTYDLIAELYGFDEKDKELLDLIKIIYVSAGDNLLPFEIADKYKDQLDTTDDKEEDRTTSDSFLNSPIRDDDYSNDNPSDSNDNFSFNDIDSNVAEESPEISENLNALRKFTIDNRTSIQTLLEDLKSNTPRSIREFIKTKYITDGVLAIEVDNKSIYEYFKYLPNHAKTTITLIGEKIRNSNNTILIDSVKVKDNRVFLVSEANTKNLFISKKDKLDDATPSFKGTSIVPNQRNIIVLENTRVDKSNRKIVPYKHNNLIAFKIKN